MVGLEMHICTAPFTSHTHPLLHQATGLVSNSLVHGITHRAEVAYTAFQSCEAHREARMTSAYAALPMCPATPSGARSVGGVRTCTSPSAFLSGSWQP